VIAAIARSRCSGDRAARGRLIFLVCLRMSASGSSKVQGVVHVPTGFLQFQADPTNPTDKPELDGDRRLVLYCGSGNRSVPGRS
jgi:rhodanese-related sulfurtransferase